MNTTGNGTSFLEYVLQMTTSTPANGSTFDGIHQQLVNNDTFLKALIIAIATETVNSGVVEIIKTPLNGTTGGSQLGGQIVAGIGPGAWPANQFQVTPFKAVINAQILQMGSGATWNPIQMDTPPTNNVTPALSDSARDDLVFIEAWRSATDGSWKTRIRIVDGVDFTKTWSGAEIVGYNSATDYSIVTPQGGNASPFVNTGTLSGEDLGTKLFRPTTGNYYNSGLPFSDDTGVWVAGYGDSYGKTTLATQDGYVYAIPLFRVKRRNSTAYDPDSNPQGASPYFMVYPTQTTAKGSNTFTVSTTDVTNFYVNQWVNINGPTINTTAKVTAVNTGTGVVTIDGTLADQSDNNHGVYPVATRPDGLWSNVIDATDIVDLRHQVSFSGESFQVLLEQGLDQLYRSQLTTQKQIQYAREYIGVNTGNYTDDANSLLFLNFDGSMAGTANGTAVANTKVGTGTEAYKNGVQGLSADFSSGNYGEQYAINIPASGWTIEGFFKQSWNGNPSGENDLFNAYSGAPGYNNRTICVPITSANGFTVVVFDASQQQHYVSIPMTGTKVGDIHYFKASYDGTTITAQLDDKIATLAYNGGSTASTYAQVATLAGQSNWFYGQIDLVRVSNIVRSGTPLPAGYSYANGDRILDGPNGDANQWSDDLGGTTLANNRTNPYGLSRVPKQIMARASYNGQEVRHYYGNGYSPGGWQNDNGTGTPTGGFNSSSEFVLVPSNEAPDGTRTSFTFNKPYNTNGMLVMFQGFSWLDAGNASLSSAAYNQSTGQLTLVYSTAPASGSSNPKVTYRVGQRHIHPIPSTKGFILHDWHDDALTGDGTKTVFQTTVYNVISLNHTRVNGAIQGSGVTITGTNARSTITAAAAAAALTVTVASASNFVANQNIRMSNGNGGWITATISSISGSTLTLTAGLSAAVPANAVIEGAALAAFATAPASGATVDVVSEYQMTPALGDYIRIHYQYTPYQGLYASGSEVGNATLLAKARGITAISWGTGKVMSNAPEPTYNVPITPQLPLGNSVYDYLFKLDSLGTSTMGLPGVGYMLHELPYISNTHTSNGNPYHNPPLGNTVALYNALARRGSTAIVANAGYMSVMGENLTAAVPHLNVYASLVQYNSTGELMLLVITTYASSSTNAVYADGGSYTAADLFHIPGRPLAKNYGASAA